MSKEALNENLSESLDITYGELDINDSFNEDSFSLEARLLSSEHLSSSLPSLSFAAKATYSRDGSDLVMTLDGESVVVKNYFATPNPPTLTTMDGAVLTPQMIASFLQPDAEQDSQDFFASSFLNNLLGGNKPLDNNAIAVVENLEGSVLVIRNGKAIALQDGDQLFQGDEISTSSDSSASMVFADGTQFKIGGEARISLDQFSYESSTSQGLQVLSILSGAFSYVSGLVAKDDPSNVQLRTPIGEIGIRGTKIVGEVDAENAAARITLLEGRVLYTTPQGEEHEIDQGFDTLNIKNGGDKVKETTISAEKTARSYDVFENAGEVSEFMQQAPAQPDQGADASQEGASADTPLPDISYSQAQADLQAQDLAAESAREASAKLEGWVVEAKASIEDQRGAILRDILGKDATDDDSLNTDFLIVGGTTENETTGSGGPLPIDTGTQTGGTGSTGDDAYLFILANLDNKVSVGQGTGGVLTGDFMNFKYEEFITGNLEVLKPTFSFFRGDFVQGNGDRKLPRFEYQDLNEKNEKVSIEWGLNEQTEGSLVSDGGDSPAGLSPEQADTLMIEVKFALDDSGNREGTFRIVFDEYFPTETGEQVPTYSISLNSGEFQKLETYNDQIEGLF